MKKPIILTESDLHRIVKESVKRILREERESSWLTEMDNLVSKWHEPYRQAKRLADMADDETISDDKFWVIKNKYYSILKDIVESVNSVVGDDFIQVSSSVYGDMVYYYLEASEENFDMAELFLEALGLNKTFSELYHNYWNKRETQKNKEKTEQQKFVDYWNKQNVSAEPASWTGGAMHTPGKYGYGIDLPKVLGKIDLPKENPRITARRNKALGK